MADGKFISYLRVSTDKQGKSGLGLDAQREAITRYLNGGSWELLAEFVEVETGKDDRRPQLDEALRCCKTTGATLVVAKLDRLSRNAGFLFKLMDGAVPFVCVDNPHATPLTLGLLAVLAQHERQVISLRTKEALAQAKARGVKLGNPNGWKGKPRNEDVSKAQAARLEKARAYRDLVIRDVQQAMAEAGSLKGAAEVLNRRGLRTRTGGQWSATAVKRLLDSSSGGT